MKEVGRIFSSRSPNATPVQRLVPQAVIDWPARDSVGYEVALLRTTDG